MKSLFTDGWEFAKLPYPTDFSRARECADGQPDVFAPVKLPHDWAIAEPTEFYEDASGWYRKIYPCEKDEDLCYILRFEGVYMDSEVWVNGTKAYEWKYGYSTFDVDISQYLHAGDNEIMVGVQYRNPNSRWYSGAGIYRNVWLLVLPKTHFVPDGIYVSTKEEAGGYRVSVQAEVAAGEAAAGETERDASDGMQQAGNVQESNAGEINVTCRIQDLTVPLAISERKPDRVVFSGEFFLPDARVWDLNDPYCYELTCELRSIVEQQNVSESQRSTDKSQWSADEQQNAAEASRQGDEVLLQIEKVQFGCRTVELKADEGFFLNHRHLKLNGVCQHHDLGALGAAVYPDALRRQLRILKEMGVNAIRTSHNMPAVELMELADEMGVLIISEAFDMWELSKTEYDYARFFPEWYKRDVASWVRRDRNHPSLIFWSIGNEIYDMHAGERGQEVTRMLAEEVLLHDPDGNGRVTFGSNYMPWENAQKCADIIKIPGYNYTEKYYNEHHEKHPDWVIYGSETSSTVQSRGVYHFPLEQPTLSDVDEQCSALGNSTTSWGAKNTESCIIAERDHPFSLGQFLWSGFDYIGEPTPYHTKNSYFGQVDTAGFPKDPYYLYQAAWTDLSEKVIVHVLPYWDFNDGQTVDVRIYTNAPYAELFVNGRTQGRQFIDHAHGMKLSADYKVAYEPGEITAVVYDEAGNELTRESRHSFGEAAELSVVCTDADGRQVILETDFTDKMNTSENKSDFSGKEERANSKSDFTDRENGLSSAGNGRQIWNDGTDSTYTLHTTRKQLLFFEIGMLDAQGYPVENANDRVEVTVTGEGTLLGLDNGDSTDYESYQATSRRLFNGKLLAILETTGNPGTVTIRLRVAEEASCRVRKIELLRQIPTNAKSSHGISATDEGAPKSAELSKPETVKTAKAAPQSVELTEFGTGNYVAEYRKLLTPQHPDSVIAVRILPKQAASQPIEYEIIEKDGIPSSLAEITKHLPVTPEERADGIADKLLLTAKGDGEFRLRAIARNGAKQAKVISVLDYTAEGLGTVYFDPYQMVWGAFYNDAIGEPGNGNDHGVATARDGKTVVGFRGVDFGGIGSDTMTLPVFELGGTRTKIDLWLGRPGEEGSSLLDTLIYEKPTIWNTYQEETYRLPRRLTGVCDLYFELHTKIHLQGFYFKRYLKALERLSAKQSDSVYGDSMRIAEDAICDIGNNVTVEFREMDFGTEGASRIRICGRTPKEKNTIHICFSDGDREFREPVEFLRTEDFSEQEFTIKTVTGMQTVSFVFLPGSKFDFKWFQFKK